jgi:uncharacterized membrane protein
MLRLSQLLGRRLSFAALLASTLSFGFAVPQSSAAQDSVTTSVQSASRIVGKIDESQLITLHGTMHPLANAKNDRGAAPASMPLDRMHLILNRSASQEAALRQLMSDMHTPGTASYHKWLTPDQFGKQFGPSDQDIATVETWLTNHGFNVIKVNPGKQTIEFSGNVAQLSSTFHTQIHKYEVDGETRYANAADPQIPAALAPVVGGFVSLNNFRPRSSVRVLGKASYNPKTDKAIPSWTYGTSSGVDYVLAPGDFAVQYHMNPLYTAGTNGTGQSIAIIDYSNINVDLVNQFRSLFGLPVNPPQVIVDGNDPGIIDGASVESYLDVEWAGAAAPQATINLVVAADTALESGGFLAAERAIYGNVAPILSSSIDLYGCEQAAGAANAFINSLWEQGAAQGITILEAAGDSGSAGCDADSQPYAVNGLGVNNWASTPYNIAVGGTDFYYSDYNAGTTALNSQIAGYWSQSPTQLPAVSLKQPIPEQPWNDSQFGLDALSIYSLTGETTIGAGSGGASNCATGTGTASNGGWATCTAGYPKPSWQVAAQSIGVPDDKVRDLPDLSLFASDGSNYSYYPICAEDADCQSPSGSNLVQITGVGGTSGATPYFAGIMALVNQLYGRQGQANYVLYPMKTQFSSAFHDITIGTNSVPCALGSTNCISAPANTIVYQGITEGQMGTGTNPDYNAAAGYNLATGLGSVDAAQLVADWNKVTFTETTTTLAPSSTSFTHGTSINITGSVTPASGTATGNVALMTSSTEQTQQGQGFASVFNGGQSVFTLSGGSFSGTNSTLPGGTYSIWGQYGGDGVNGMSTSTPVQITVAPEASGIDFNIFSSSGTFNSATPPGNSVDYGTQLNLSAIVAPNSQLSALESCTTTCPVFTLPTGTVNFLDNGTALNTALINAEGDAEYNAPFTVGSHSVTAKYSGDQSYTASTAAAIPFTVVKDSPEILLYAPIQDGSNNDLVNGPGQPTVLTVQIENQAQYSSGLSNQVAAPTGTVNVSSSLTGVNGTATLTPALDPATNALAGVATFTVPAGSVSGSYSVKVTYSGDGNYNTATGTSTITIENTTGDGGLNATIAATATGSVSPSTNVTVTGTVTGPSGKAAPTGAIYAYSVGDYPNGVSLVPGTGNVSTFSMVLNSQNLFQGSNTITLQYLGSTTYNPAAYTLPAAISNSLSDFTLIPDSTIVPVTSSTPGTDTINLASVNGFTGTVALTCTAATGVTCSVSPSESLSKGGSAAATLTINAPSTTANKTYNVLVTGKDSTGKYVHTLGISAVVSDATPAFSLTNSGNLSFTAGAATGNTSTITITPSNGLTGAVNLSCAVTAPGGATSPATCSIPASVTISGTTAQTATLSVNTTTATTAGAYTVTVTGTATGASTQTTVVTADVAAAPVPGFTLVNGGNITLTPGATTGNTSSITVTPTNGLTGAVNLSCAVTSPSGATSPATCSIPASVTITGTGAQTATLTVNTTSATTAGAYTVKVTGTATGAATQTTTVTATVVVPGFTLANSGNLSFTAGAATGNTSTITVTPTNGLTGAVGLSCGVAAPAGAANPATCTILPASVTIAGTAAQAATLTVNTTATTTPGSYSVTVTGTAAGATTQTTTVTAVISAPPVPGFTLTNSGNITVIAGATTGNTSIITVTPVNGLTGTVSLNCIPSGPSGVTSPATCSITPSSVDITGATAQTATLTVTTTSTTTAGAYTVTVTGTAASVASQTTSVTVTVNSGFTLSNSGAISVSPGATTGNTSTITINPVGGFSGTVSLTCAITSAPSGAIDSPTCSLSPASATTTSTLTVNTTAATTTRNNTSKPFWPAAGGAVLALLVFFGIPARKRNWTAMLGLLLLFVSAAAIGCGGGSGGGGGGGNSGTTAGTYTVTVTGTSAGVTATTPVTLTVE